MYFTTLEHLKAGIKAEELLYPDYHMDVPRGFLDSIFLEG